MLMERPKPDPADGRCGLARAAEIGRSGGHSVTEVSPRFISSRSASGPASVRP